MRNEYASLPGELHLRFELMDADLVRLGWHMWRRRLSTPESFVVYVALVAGSAIGLAIHRPEMVALIASVAISISVTYLVAALLHKPGRKIAARRDRTPSPARTVDIDRDGLRYAAADRTAQVPWSRIVSVSRSRDQIDLIRTDTDGYVLPRRAFDTDSDFDSAYAVIKRYVRQSRKAAPAPEPEAGPVDLAQPSISFQYSVYDLKEMAAKLTALSGPSRRYRFIARACFALLTISMFILLDWNRMHSGRDVGMILVLVLPMAAPDWLSISGTSEAASLLARPGMKLPQSATATGDALVHRCGGAIMTYRWRAVRSIASDDTGIYIVVTGSIVAIPFTAFHRRRQMERYAEALREFQTGAGSTAAA